jgi:threonine dehydrogenase-like Zn-dependent dehydrogenase
MSIRWARAAGVEKILVTDQIAVRLDLARRGGATATIAKPVAEAQSDILAANDGELPDVVIDGTGNAAVFAAALPLARKYGRVVLLGDTGSPTQQRLTNDVVTRGLTIVGAHDGHARDPWTESRIVRFFFTLLADGRMDMDGMNTHEFAPEDCGKVYDQASNRRQETMGILFDWTKG